MDTTEIPVPGTPAYWAAQREAVALLKAYNFGHPDLFVELGALRHIAAHGFAASMMAAQGDCLADLINGLERMAEALEADDEEDEEDEAAGPAACVRPGHPPQPRMAEAQDTRGGPRAAAPACSTLDRGR